MGQQGRVIVAANVLSRSLVVVTGNLGELRRVGGLRCEGWLTKAG